MLRLRLSAILLVAALRAAPAGVIAYWPCDDFGAALTDISGNGHTAAVVGATRDQGIRGTALRLNGSTDYAVVSEADVFAPSSAITVELWVNVEDFGTLPSLVLMAKWGAAGWTNDSWSLTVAAGGHRACLSTSTGSTYVTSTSADTVPLNQWVHVVGTWNGTETRTYVNGVSGAAVPWTGGLNSANAEPFYIGRSGHLDMWMNGRIDEVRILDVALTPQEVLARYQSFGEDVPVLQPYAPDPTTDRTPTLTWGTVAGAVNYRILVDTSLAFAAPRVSALTGGDTTYTVTSPLPYGPVYWKVSCNLDYGLYSTVDAFTVVDPAYAPVLVPYPYDTTADRYPMLSWLAVDGATGYAIQVAGNPGFAPMGLSDTVGTTRYIPSQALPFGTVYWRVASSRNYLFYSETDSFVVIPFAAPEILRPAEMAGVSPSDSLVWSASRDPSSVVTYELLISTTPDFSSDTVVAMNSVPGTHVRIGDLSPVLPAGRLLFWKVRAANGWGAKSAYSPTRSFNLTPVGVAAAGTAGLCDAVAVKRDGLQAGIVIHYTLAHASAVSVALYDMLGHLVRQFTVGMAQPGRYALHWDGRDSRGNLAAQGGYVVRFRSANIALDLPVLNLR